LGRVLKLSVHDFSWIDDKLKYLPHSAGVRAVRTKSCRVLSTAPGAEQALSEKKLSRRSFKATSDSSTEEQLGWDRRKNPIVSRQVGAMPLCRGL
jgi:hypothetical protein